MLVIKRGGVKCWTKTTPATAVSEGGTFFIPSERQALGHIASRRFVFFATLVKTCSSDSFLWLYSLVVLCIVCLFLLVEGNATPDEIDMLWVSILYLLLPDFEVCTVSYGPSFFLWISGPSAKRAGHKSTGKTRIRSLQFGARK